MFKKIIIQTGLSYFKKSDDKIYDLTRDNTIKIKLFGITIYEKQDIIRNNEVIDIDNKTKKIGFQDK